MGETELDLERTYKERVESIVKTAIKFKIEQDTELIPSAHIWEGEDHLAIYATPFEDADGKAYAAKVIKRKCQDPKVDLLVYVLESFVLKLTPEEMKDYDEIRKQYPYLGDHPRAEECIIFMVETKYDSYTGQSIITKKDGKTEISQPTWSEGEGQGTFTNFIPKAQTKGLH